MTSDLMFPATASEQNKPSFIQTANRQKDFGLEKKGRSAWAAPMKQKGGLIV